MNTTKCRHGQILDHFGQSDLVSDPTSCCDNCALQSTQGNDVTRPCRLVLQTLTELNVGITAICGILAGARSKITQSYADSKWFGVGKVLSKEGWKQVVEELVGQNLIQLTFNVKVMQGDEQLNKSSCRLSPTEEGVKFLENVDASFSVKLSLERFVWLLWLLCLL